MRKFSSILRDIPSGLTTENQIILLTNRGHHYVSYDQERNLVATQELVPDTADLRLLVRAYEDLTFTSLGTLKSMIYAHRPGQPLTIRASLVTLINNPINSDQSQETLELHYHYQSQRQSPALNNQTSHHIVAALALPWQMHIYIPKMSVVTRMQLIQNPEIILDEKPEYSREMKEVIRSLDLQVDRDTTLGLIEQRISNPDCLTKHHIVLLRDPYCPMPELSWYHYWLTSTNECDERSIHPRSFQSWRSMGPTQLDALIEAILRPEAILIPGATMRNSRGQNAINPAITHDLLKTALEQQALVLDPPNPGTIPIRKDFQKEILKKCPNWPDVVEATFEDHDDNGTMVSLTGIEDYNEITVKEIPCTPESLWPHRPENIENNIKYHLANLAYVLLEHRPSWEINMGSRGTINIYLKAEKPYAEIASYIKNEPNKTWLR